MIDALLAGERIATEGGWLAGAATATTVTIGDEATTDPAPTISTRNGCVPARIRRSLYSQGGIRSVAITLPPSKNRARRGLAMPLRVARRTMSEPAATDSPASTTVSVTDAAAGSPSAARAAGAIQVLRQMKSTAARPAHCRLPGTDDRMCMLSP